MKEFHLPFGSTLDPENRWIHLEALMQWNELSLMRKTINQTERTHIISTFLDLRATRPRYSSMLQQRSTFASIANETLRRNNKLVV